MLNNKIKRGYENLEIIVHLVQEFIDDILWDNNNYHPSYALQYKNLVESGTQLGFN